jgi:hypothetical protein
VVSQQTFVVQEASTGFAVQPRVTGTTVHLDIAPQREMLAPRGTVQSQRIATSAIGRLGEWFEIGGVVAASSRDARGLTSASRAAEGESRRVWVKVEELRPEERRN